jgi:hypothetical protein
MAQEPRQGVQRNGESSVELEAYRQAQLAEYQQYVAATDIYAGQALAYREGDPVPKSNVERHGYDKMGLVVDVQAAPPADLASKKPANK